MHATMRPVAFCQEKEMPPDLIKMRKESELELQFWVQCAQARWLPDPEWHVKIFGVETDFSWAAFMLIVQIQGGVNDGSGKSRGAHVRRDGYIRDRDFANLAQADGWTVFEFTDKNLNGNECLGILAHYIARFKIKTQKREDIGSFVRFVAASTNSQCSELLRATAKKLLE